MTRILIAPLLVTLSSVATAAGSGRIMPSTHESSSTRLDVAVEDASGGRFGVQVSLDPTFQRNVQFLGMALLDGAGDGHAAFPIPPSQAFPPNTVAYLRAGYTDGGQLVFTAPEAILLNPVPVERIDFRNAPACVGIANGERIEDQWAPVGVRIKVDTHHPTLPARGIALDSTAPGPETDLQTPGVGIGNTEDRDHLLVVAGDPTGFASSTPVAEELGGVFVFDFDQPTYLDRITFIDVDRPGGFMRCYDGSTLMAEMSVPDGGDNSCQTMGFPLMPVTRLLVNIKCAGGIADLTYLPCAERIDFDNTLTGIPLGLRDGEIVQDQLRGQYGMRVFADTHHPTNVGRAITLPAGSMGPAQDSCDRMWLGVAADSTDADNDGIADVAGPEPLGGVIVMDFDFDVTWRSARVVDVDQSEVSFFRAHDADGNLLGHFPLTVGADGSVQVVAPDLSGVRRIRLNLGGDGALLDLDYCADAHPEAQGVQ